MQRSWDEADLPKDRQERHPGDGSVAPSVFHAPPMESTQRVRASVQPEMRQKRKAYRSVHWIC